MNPADVIKSVVLVIANPGATSDADALSQIRLGDGAASDLLDGLVDAGFSIVHRDDLTAAPALDAIVARWWQDRIAGSAIARNTDAYNALVLSFVHLKAALRLWADQHMHAAVTAAADAAKAAQAPPADPAIPPIPQED